jgi:hypothetical protein
MATTETLLIRGKSRDSPHSVVIISTVKTRIFSCIFCKPPIARADSLAPGHGRAENGCRQHRQLKYDGNI